MHPRRFRKSRGLTVHEMAEKIGAANGSTVSKQERGLVFPSPDYIEAWREASGGKVQYEDWVELRDQILASPKAAIPERTECV